MQRYIPRRKTSIAEPHTHRIGCGRLAQSCHDVEIIPRSLTKGGGQFNSKARMSAGFIEGEDFTSVNTFTVVNTEGGENHE